MAAGVAPTVLSDDLIARCGERAAKHDRDNTFFTDDFEELRRSGYLTMAVPAAFGGRGVVSVYEHVDGAALLERLSPGEPLAALALSGRDDEATDILATLLGLWYVPGVHGTWGSVRDQRRAVASALEQMGVPLTDRLMSIDAAGYKYYTGRGGVVLVNDPLETIRSVAEAYDIRWLVLERADAVPAMEPVLAGTARPVWIGAPVWTLEDGAGARGGGDTGASLPAVAIYPVCTQRNDERCGTAAK